ncbi:cell death abnormality protein 1-like [Saccostrea cucullata]|uniref:cell death abnormality protein 1-like n=1 Tax=Saccostrea cuccullata TaxID=36930 RepID=UPI002ED60C45
MAFMVYWYFYLLCISLTRQDLVGDNVCLFKSTKSCCKDYKQDGNICVECDPGFRGINCSSSCPNNYFGRRCFHKCECSSFQYCDSRRGCLCNVTSENCTDANEPDTTDTQLTKLFKITTKTSSNEQAYQSSSYVVKIGIPSLLSVIVFLIIGHICIRVYQKKKNENVKKGKHDG